MSSSTPLASNVVSMSCMLFPLPKEKTSSATGDKVEPILQERHTVPCMGTNERRSSGYSGCAEVVRWAGMNPLLMVEEIASFVESKMNLSERRAAPPLIVQTSFLPEATADLPHPLPPSSQIGLDLARYLSERSDGGRATPIGAVRSEIAPATGSDAAGEALSGRKRGRASSDGTDGCEDRNNCLVAAVPPLPNVAPSETRDPAPTFAALPPWDPSYLVRCDPDPLAARRAADAISGLAAKIEAAPSYGQCVPSYRRVRDHLAHEIGHALRGHKDKNFRRERLRIVLDELYKDTIGKMEALAQMVENMPIMKEEEKATVASAKSNSWPRSKEVEDVNSQRALVRREMSKKDFAELMNGWLRENWSNPYPDDEGLADLARKCGTTPTVVSNWLINARTRKWRPAIVKAYEAGRPSDLLKEDAINIFDGQELREIEGLQIIQSEPLSNRKGKGRGT